MLNKLKFNTLSLSFLFLMFVLAWGTTTTFAAETTIYNPSLVMTANGEDFESNVIDSGSVDIDFECVDSMRGEGKEYRVYVNEKVTFPINGTEHWQIFDCGFRIIVSNNQITYKSDYINIPSYYNNKLHQVNPKSVMFSFNFVHGHHTLCFHMVAILTGFNNNIYGAFYWVSKQ